MPFEPITTGKFIPFDASTFEPELEGDTVSLDTFEEGEKYYVSTPQQRQEWLAQGSMGAWEYGNKTWFSDVYYGSIMGAGSLTGLVNRLQEDDYKTDEAKSKDLDGLRKVMLWKEEMETRGLSFWGSVYKITANIPAFAMEMAMTSGMASMIRGSLKKGAVEAGKKGLMRKATDVLAREAVVGLARTTVMPHRYIAAYQEKELNEHLSITDKGIQILDDSATDPAITFMKAYGDTFVEYYSETLGGELLKPAGKVAARGVLNKIPKATREAFTKIADGLAKKLPKGR